jgi:hypothetical protein
VTGHEATHFEQSAHVLHGLGILVAVPIFKSITHLPPFMGILFGLGILWAVGDLLHHGKTDDETRST